MPISREPRAVDGFTLVELLVVVLILAILTSVALPLYNNTIQDASQRAARANMQTIATAEQAYRLRSPALTFTPNLSDLTEVKNISGPGDRTYTIMPNTNSSPGNPCVANPFSAPKTKQNIPANSFAISTSHSEDGCYIPGVSHE